MRLYFTRLEDFSKKINVGRGRLQHSVTIFAVKAIVRLASLATERVHCCRRRRLIRPGHASAGHQVFSLGSISHLLRIGSCLTRKLGVATVGQVCDARELGGRRRRRLRGGRGGLASRSIHHVLCGRVLGTDKFGPKSSGGP